MYGSMPISKYRIARYLFLSEYTNYEIPEKFINLAVNDLMKKPDRFLVKKFRRRHYINLRVFAPGLFQIIYDL